LPSKVYEQKLKGSRKDCTKPHANYIETQEARWGYNSLGNYWMAMEEILSNQVIWFIKCASRKTANYGLTKSFFFFCN